MPPRNLPRLIVVSSPGGTCRSEALARIKKAIEQTHKDGTTVAVVDLEEKLGDLVKTYIAEDHKIARAYFRRFTKDNLPKTQSVIWDMPREVVAHLWAFAARKAVAELLASEATVKILSAHLVYYRGKTREFYSPVDIRALTTDKSGAPVAVVSRVVTLIDDIYDMYWRLSQADQVYDYDAMLEGEHAKMADKGDLIENKTAPQQYLIAIRLILSCLSGLLAWREKELLAAELVGRASGVESALLAVKHPTTVGTAVVSPETARMPIASCYLSHPISRPRDKERRDAEWPPFVAEFQEIIQVFHEKLATSGVCAIMPTAIDEFRIKIKKAQKSKATTSKKPKKVGYEEDLFSPGLATRWPLIDRPDKLLYSFDANFQNYEEFDRELQARIFNPELVVDSGKRITGGRYTTDPQELDKAVGAFPLEIQHELSGLLRAFIFDVELQMTHRDHSLVRQCSHFFLYRPLYEEYGWSRGVGAELENHAAIIRGLEALGSAQQRRLFLIHAKKDIAEAVSDDILLTSIQPPVAKFMKDTIGIDLKPGEVRRVDPRGSEWFETFVAPRSSSLDAGRSPEERKALKEAKAEIEGYASKVLAAAMTGMAISYLQCGGIACESFEELDEDITKTMETKRRLLFWQGRIDRVCEFLGNGSLPAITTGTAHVPVRETAV